MKEYLKEHCPARSTRERAVKELALCALDTDDPAQTLRDMPTPDKCVIAKMMLAPSEYRRSNQGRGDDYRGKTWAQHFDDMRQDALRLIGRTKYELEYGA